MSLLLEALKKAEKAKDEAKRRAQEAAAPAGSGSPARHVRTRNELPDISTPEIHSEDIPGGLQILDPVMPKGRIPAGDLRLADEPPPATSAPPEPPRESAADLARKRRQGARPDAAAADAQASERVAAKSVFEAKYREPNPKLPFYITMALLGVLALGTAVYFWYQLRPPPALVNPNAKPPTEEKVVVAQPPAGAIQPAQQTGAQPPELPGLPAQTPAGARSAVTPVVTPAPAAAKPPYTTATPSPQAAIKPTAPTAAPVQPRSRGPASAPAPQSSAQAARAPADPSGLSVSRAPAQVNPKLEAGWLAYNQGNLPAARSSYQDMLREDPMNRDALLGMAALEVRAQRFELAEIYYQKLLETDPRDAHAQAGLFALRAQMTDPVQAESRVKNLLANDPGAHVLYFTLGNQYAQQGRWQEAQQAYFKAFSADPENPDFAYNLAVSLDQVRQPRLALEYYRRAIALAQQRSSNFDQVLARNRVQELAR